jgi:maltose alpha-D-glucosyltransferase/alpha-amylase
MNSILLSFRGTPIIYYGDEIGMGDNVYLGDRNGVRTPMQWTSDRNAGFSRVTPAKLYSPVIMDPVYGYESVNVEAQQTESASFLNWMRNMVALRKLFRVFGRGTIEFLRPENRKVLAYVRSFEGENVLCVANLSRFAQPTELDLSRFEGMVPVEMLGYVEFPRIRKTPYALTLAHYGYFWFELQTPAAPALKAEEDTSPDPTVPCGSWAELLDGTARVPLESALPQFLIRQRWFGGKARTIDRVGIRDAAEVPGMDAALVIVDVRYLGGNDDVYFLPLIRLPAERVQAAFEKYPQARVVKCRDGAAELWDATVDEGFCQWLLQAVDENASLPFLSGTLHARAGRSFAAVRGDTALSLPAQRSSAEQSNTSVRFGERIIMKLFRRLDAGPNPDCELTQYLSEERGNTHVPTFVGTFDYAPREGERTALGILQSLIDNQGDGWSWMLEELSRYYESCATRAFPSSLRSQLDRPLLTWLDDGVGGEAVDIVGLSYKAAAMLSRRTAEMHIDLAAETTNPAFRFKLLGKPEFAALSLRLREHSRHVFDGLKHGIAGFSDEVVDHAALVLGKRREITERFRALEDLDLALKATRVHGDYHLGQVLRVREDFVVLDFEGEPARPIAERRMLESPLKDVAGMLRSFSYAAQVGYLNYVARRPREAGPLEPWARLWESCVSAAFLRNYREAIGGLSLAPTSPADFELLLDAFLLDKALYELDYELNHRPAWVRIPLLGILSLCR